MKKLRAYSYIRFSSPDQAKGDSLRRQTEESRKWCEQHDIQLDEKLTFRDLGISGFDGSNIRDNAGLGQFLMLIERGDVPIGSYLLIEDFDRLTRMPIMMAFDLFRRILESGVKIVTVGNGRIYDQGSLNQVEGLLEPLLFMQVGHLHSKRISDEVKKAWAKKRQHLSEHPLTSKCPAWIEMKDGKFQLVPEKAKVIKHMFKMALSGKSPLMICRELNSSGTPPLDPRAKVWHYETVKLLLKDKKVIGEFQAHQRMRKSKLGGNKSDRAPIGDPIPNYYPHAVDEETFNKVQSLSKNRRRMQGKERVCPNLFAGMVICHCGSTMVRIPSGKHPEIKKKPWADGYPYACMVCKASKNGCNCNSVSWNYWDFEELVLRHLQYRIKKSDLQIKNVGAELEQTESELTQIKQQKQVLAQRMRKWEDSIADYTGKDAKGYNQRIQARIDEAHEEIVKFEGRLSQLEGRKTILQRQDKDPGEKIRELVEYIACMWDPSQRDQMRLKLRLLLQELIDKIIVWPKKAVQIRFKSGQFKTMFTNEADQDWIFETFGYEPTTLEIVTLGQVHSSYQPYLEKDAEYEMEEAFDPDTNLVQTTFYKVNGKKK